MSSLYDLIICDTCNEKFDDNDIISRCYKCHTQQAMWNKVENLLPGHSQVVLTYNGKTQVIAIFVDGEKMRQLLGMNGIIDKSNDHYYFCSQEIKSHVFNNITHWKELDVNPRIHK